MSLNEPFSLTNSWINSRNSYGFYTDSFVSKELIINKNRSKKKLLMTPKYSIDHSVGQELGETSSLDYCEESHEPSDKSDHICSICKDPYDVNTMVHLQCYHCFHYDCILEWFKISKNDKKNARTCPLCREYGGFLPKKHNHEELEDIHFPSNYLKSNTSLGINEIIDLFGKYIKNLGLKFYNSNFSSSLPNPSFPSPLPISTTGVVSGAPVSTGIVPVGVFSTTLNNNSNGIISQINNPNNLVSGKCLAIINSKSSKNYGKQCINSQKSGTFYCGIHSYLHKS